MSGITEEVIEVHKGACNNTREEVLAESQVWGRRPCNSNSNSNSRCSSSNNNNNNNRGEEGWGLRSKVDRRRVSNNNNNNNRGEEGWGLRSKVDRRRVRRAEGTSRVGRKGRAVVREGTGDADGGISEISFFKIMAARS